MLTVTVIEISQEVIDVVAQHIADDRATFTPMRIKMDATKKGMCWNVVWPDIWNDICADNLSEMEKLHRRYARRCDWQGSWCRVECQRARKI